MISSRRRDLEWPRNANSRHPTRNSGHTYTDVRADRIWLEQVQAGGAEDRIMLSEGRPAERSRAFRQRRTRADYAWLELQRTRERRWGQLMAMGSRRRDQGEFAGQQR